jgi:hypothetical protein
MVTSGSGRGGLGGVGSGINFMMDRVHNSDTPYIVILFLFSIAIHLFDALVNNFSRTGGNFQLLLGLYSGLTLFAIFFVYKSGFSSETVKIIGVSLFAFLLPFILNFFGPPWLIAIFLAAPVWALYLFANPGDSLVLSKIGKWYLFIVLILAVYVFATSIVVGDNISSQGIDTTQAVGILDNYFIKNTQKLWGAITGFPSRIQLRINQSLGMDYFTGRVESNKDEPLGVYLEDLRATEPVFYEGNDIVLWATLSGKSFEGEINVRNRCYAGEGETIRYGEMFPTEVSLFYIEQTTLECVFEDGLPSGNNKITFKSSFDFPTWGYVTYTFVDRETMRSYYSQKKDINEILDIPKIADVVYTNGPAAIGLPNLNMPISVNSEETSDNALRQVFGVTLENRWAQGKISHINSLEVKVPEEFSLTDCRPVEPINITREEDHSNYLFALQTPDETFTTVSCRMIINNPADFFQDALKVSKTFAVRANYNYILGDSVSVGVKK